MGSRLSPRPYMRFRRLLEAAEDADVANGREDYRNHNATLRAIGEVCELPTSTVAGVFSALSPNNDYLGNLRSCFTCCVGHVLGKTAEECTVTTYNTNRAKAFRILNGEHFYEVYKGLKVRNFWHNLCDPEDPRYVTIDGHMVNIADDEVKGMSQAGLGKRRYAELKGDVIRLAKSKDMVPCQVQAVLWHAWKRRHAIKFQGTAGQVDFDFDCLSTSKVHPKAIRLLPIVGVTTDDVQRIATVAQAVEI